MFFHMVGVAAQVFLPPKMVKVTDAPPAFRRSVRVDRKVGRCGHDPAISMILQTVLQLRSVIGTPRSFSELAASFDLPTPSGACR